MSELLLTGRIPLDGPLPRPPRHSILSVATQVTPGEPHWRLGGQIWPQPYTMPTGHDPCAEGSDTKDMPEETTLPDPFPAYTVYLGELCSAAGIANDWAGFQERANRALAARTAWALERQLVDASFVTAPSLNDTTTEVLNSGSPVAARSAIAYLDDAIADLGIEGVIHITPGVATYLGFEQLVDDGGILRTASGTPVIVGRGYAGSDENAPDPPYSEDAAGNGQDWIYATTEVLYRTGPIEALPETIGEALDRDDNSVIYRAEQDLWVAWDGQLQVAVLADWSP